MTWPDAVAFVAFMGGIVAFAWIAMRAATRPPEESGE